MARRKVVIEDEVRDLTEADELLKRLGEIETVLTANDTRMTERIAQVKLQFVAYAQPYMQERKQLEMRLCLYAKAHPEIFGAARSRRLNNGVIGFRRSSKIKLLVTVQEAIENIRKLGLAKLLLKEQPKLDKVKLAQQPADVLATVGAEIRGKDTFFVTINQERVEDVSYDE